MRWSFLLLLLAGGSSGCLDEAQGLVPVVLVESSYEVTGEGRAAHVFVPTCEMARYGRDPWEVTLHRAPAEGAVPTFVVVQDVGDSWRAANASAEGGRVFANVASASPGPFWWMADSSVSLLGFTSIFPEGAREGRSVTWDGDRASYDGTRLRPGAPLTRVFEYDVPTEEGGSLHVKETARVTYVGKVPVSFEERPCA